MKLLLSKKALQEYLALPPKLQASADKQFGFLVEDIRHPSLRAKKYEGRDDLWQARITREYRFYFRISADVYEVVSISGHPK